MTTDQARPDAASGSLPGRGPGGLKQGIMLLRRPE
jgi:hypothetical protein